MAVDAEELTMRARLKVGQLVGRLVLSGFSFLFGGFLLVSGLSLWERPPAFLPLTQVDLSAWTAFDGGLIFLATSLMALAIAASVRTSFLWQRRGKLTPGASGSLRSSAAFQATFPRYVIDVAISLAISAAALTLPVLLAGGPPMVFLGFFATSLGMISLIAGGLIGVVRG